MPVIAHRWHSTFQKIQQKIIKNYYSNYCEKIWYITNILFIFAMRNKNNFDLPFKD